MLIGWLRLSSVTLQNVASMENESSLVRMPTGNILALSCFSLVLQTNPSWDEEHPIWLVS